MSFEQTQLTRGLGGLCFYSGLGMDFASLRSECFRLSYEES